MNDTLIRALHRATLLLLLALPAQAQERPAGQWRPVGDLTAGWHAFGPVLFSVTAAAGVGSGDMTYPETGTQFFLIAAEPGIKGGRASLIYAKWLGFQGGAILRGTVLRFWSSDHKRTYVGAEAQWVISLLPIGIRVGAFRPTDDRLGPRKTLWLADLSVMY